jgi:uncharacterized membrane protein YgdD (TMEM256/DUF423 family)
MTLAALSAMAAAGVATAATVLLAPGRAADLLKAGAAIQFMHSMATLACATVVQIGGTRARHAPAFFLAGIVLLPGSLYALASGASWPVWPGAAAGALASAVGWIILVAGTLGVDPQPAAAPGRREATIHALAAE